mgnify:CR=1 FL=1
MENLTVLNPFVVGRYVSDKYFCDREKETEFLIKQIENGRNIALISPRRMGKTGLVQHCFQQPRLNENYYTFFVDIYATSSSERIRILYAITSCNCFSTPSELVYLNVLRRPVTLTGVPLVIVLRSGMSLPSHAVT